MGCFCNLFWPIQFGIGATKRVQTFVPKLVAVVNMAENVCNFQSGSFVVAGYEVLHKEYEESVVVFVKNKTWDVMI